MRFNKHGQTLIRDTFTEDLRSGKCYELRSRQPEHGLRKPRPFLRFNLSESIGSSRSLGKTGAQPGRSIAWGRHLLAILFSSKSLGPQLLIAMQENSKYNDVHLKRFVGNHAPSWSLEQVKYTPQESNSESYSVVVQTANATKHVSPSPDLRLQVHVAEACRCSRLAFPTLYSSHSWLATNMRNP